MAREPVRIMHADDFERTGGWRLVRRSLELESFGMNVVEIAPGESIPEHDETGRDQEEVFIVLSGSPTLVVDGERASAAAGQLRAPGSRAEPHGGQPRRRAGDGADRLGAALQRLRADGLGLAGYFGDQGRLTFSA